MLFIATISFGQTEEQTILWLKDYGMPMIESDYYSGEIKDNKIIIAAQKNTVHYKVWEISFDCLASMHVTDNPYLNDGSGDAIQLTFRENCALLIDKTSSSEYSEYRDAVGFGFNKSTNYTDRAQFHKALMHLAELHGATPKPEIKKDMFK